jgi:hypothetical protein
MWMFRHLLPALQPALVPQAGHTTKAPGRAAAGLGGAGGRGRGRRRCHGGGAPLLDDAAMAVPCTHGPSRQQCRQQRAHLHALNRVHRLVRLRARLHALNRFHALLATVAEPRQQAAAVVVGITTA